MGLPNLVSHHEAGASLPSKQFTDESYVSSLAQRLSTCVQARTTSIEWTFGIVGVLLAAAAATPNQGTLIPALLSYLALALTIPLVSLATGSQSTCRNLSLVSSHITHLRFSEVLLTPKGVTKEDFEQHLARFAVQADLLGARVQTRASLYRDVLFMGPGYLFVGGLAMFAYSWHSFLIDAGALSTLAAITLAVLEPAVVLVVLIWIVWNTTLKEAVANLTEMPECPVCKAQGRPSDRERLLKDGKPLEGFEKLGVRRPEDHT
jgi:hypothetical protein